MEEHEKNQRYWLHAILSNKLTALKCILIWYVLFVIAFTGRSQTLPTRAGYYTKTTTYSSVHTDAFSFTANQAALANSKSMSIGLFGERKFLLEDLHFYQLAFVLPTTSGNFGTKANYSGTASYNQSELGLAYSRNLDRIDVGVEFNYFSIQAAGYGKLLLLILKQAPCCM